MAKYDLRLKARKLRSKGLSVKGIARELHTSSSSVSRWVNDVILTEEQVEALKKSELSGKEVGRLKCALIKRRKRLALIEASKQEGIKTVDNLSIRELLIGGLALYWGEGGKTDRRVEFCNSDPRVVKFLIYWLQVCFGIQNEDLRCVVGINQIHLEREQIVKEYWSKITGISLSQFRKTSFKRSVNKKIYTNYDSHYGTLSVLVVKSTTLYYKIMGLIEGLGISLVNKMAA